MELSIQERLKDLRVERGLTLEQLAEKTHLSKSALGSYEGDNLKDISHYALIELAKFYEVTVDYLLGRSQTRNHPNADLADLHLSDDMIELLKSGLVDNSLLCELATHPDFPRLMADLEIYVNGVAGKQVQSANAIVDAVSATIMKQQNPGLTDPQLRQLIAAHIDDDSFCRYVIQQDINKIALDLREAHKDDFFSVPGGQHTGRFFYRPPRRDRQPGQRPGTGGDGVYLQAAQTELQEAVRGRKEMAETDCAEVEFAEKIQSRNEGESKRATNQNLAR